MQPGWSISKYIEYPVRNNTPSRFLAKAKSLCGALNIKLRLTLKILSLDQKITILRLIMIIRELVRLKVVNRNSNFTIQLCSCLYIPRVVPMKDAASYINYLFCF